jgi:thymidylate synthase ThyX
LSINTLEEKKTEDGKTALLIQQNDVEQVEQKEQEQVPPHVLMLLDMFLTHTDRPVYAFKHLPPDFIAGLFARYSKSGKPIVEVFIELCEEMGEEFTDEVCLTTLKSELEMLDKFMRHPAIDAMHEKYTKKGHESIKKLSDGIPVAIDSCSMLAASQIANGRTGFQLIERSTRYQKNFFEPNYVRGLFADKEISMRFDLFMNTAFKVSKAIYDDIYSALISLKPYNAEDKMVVELGIDEKTWIGWIKNRALDSARYALPVAATTGMGVVGNVMAYERMCEKLISSESAEFVSLGGLIGEAVNAVSPSVFTMPLPNRHDAMYNNFNDSDIATFRELILNSVANESKVLLGPPTSDVDICRFALDAGHMSSEDSMLYYAAVAIARQLALPPDVVYHWMCSPWFKNLASLSNPAPGFKDSRETSIVNHVDFALRIMSKFTGEYDEQGQLSSYRDPIYRESQFDSSMAEIVGFEKLPRIYELVNMTFDMVVDFGAWRDLNRHSVITNIQWPLVPNLGYAVPDDFDLLSDITKDLYQSLFAMSVDMWDSVMKKYGVAMAQYAGLMMWNQRRWLRMNVREADYIIQLRSRWAGHHSYRRIAQLMYKRILALWPNMRQMLKCDTADYVFGMVRRTNNDHKNSNTGISTSKEYVPLSQRVKPGEN